MSAQLSANAFLSWVRLLWHLFRALQEGLYVEYFSMKMCTSPYNCCCSLLLLSWESGCCISIYLSPAFRRVYLGFINLTVSDQIPSFITAYLIKAHNLMFFCDAHKILLIWICKPKIQVRLVPPNADVQDTFHLLSRVDCFTTWIDLTLVRPVKG